MVCYEQNKLIVFGGKVSGYYTNKVWCMSLRNPLVGYKTWSLVKFSFGMSQPEERAFHSASLFKNGDKQEEIIFFGGK